MKRLLLLVSAMCACWTTTATGQINLLTNGGFEDQRATTQPQRFFSGGNIGGWLVGGQGDAHVDLHLDSGQPYEGVQYVAMGESGGYISQLVNLNAGRDYTLQFYARSESTLFPPGSFQVDVVSEYSPDTLQNSRTIANAILPVTHLCTCSADPRPLPWSGFSTNFTADAEQERLSFHFGPSDNYYFLIDAISLVEVPVPEPSALLLLGVAIFGLIGTFNRQVICRLSKRR